MGLLIDGEWHEQWYDTKKSGGKFQRENAQFRHWLDTEPSSARHDDETVFPVAADRYHLYVSLACPWAHRTLIMRQLKGLTQLIGVTVVSPHMLQNGWQFDAYKGQSDPLYQADFLYQIYLRARADYTGRVTVPVLWDKQRHTIVNNESADIVRIFNSAFDELTGNTFDFYPVVLRNEIDELNRFIYERINNGVYKAGFATTQQAYEDAFDALFSALDALEIRLSRQRYLHGDWVTESDIRLFTTLVRFDAVYFGHFKCNYKRLADYRNLSGFVRDIYQLPGVAQTVDLEHIKQHYYYSHDMINPSRIVPKGPTLDFSAEHRRMLLAPEGGLPVVPKVD